MAHDVFISYSRDDATIANAVCHHLEAVSLRCWIAPRDVLPGTNYGESIAAAIKATSLFVVIFSASTNGSRHVIREVERAISHGVAIIPFRIEDAVPTQGLEYFLSACHWLDAMSPPLEKHIARLVECANVLLRRSTAHPKSASADHVTGLPAQHSNASSLSHLPYGQEHCTGPTSPERVGRQGGIVHVNRTNFMSKDDDGATAVIQFSLTNCCSTLQKVTELCIVVDERCASQSIRLTQSGAVLREYPLRASLLDAAAVNLLDAAGIQILLEPSATEAFSLELTAEEGVLLRCHISAVFTEIQSGTAGEARSASFAVDYPIRSMAALHRRRGEEPHEA